jgi:dihydroflavonol-4-reductase
MSRYLVTGATGFLGRHLTALLTANGHSVVALCRSASARVDGAEIAHGDVLDKASVERAAQGVDGVFHLAGKVSRKPEDAEELFRVHVEGTKVTLDAARAAGVRRVVVASTSGTVAVSRDEKIIDETGEDPIDLVARWPYYRSKLYAEKAAFDRNGPGFEVVSINPTLLLGPGDTTESSTGDVVKFLERKVPFVPGGGMSFVDARDAATGAWLAMEKGRAGQRYLLAAQNLTIEAFFKRLERISGVTAPTLRTPRSLGFASIASQLMERVSKRVAAVEVIDRVSAEMAQCFWYVDSNKAIRELGWVARDPNETLGDTVRDLVARGVAWPS